MQTQTVIEIIASRMVAKHAGQPFDDIAVLGLAVEGGGMRGIISAGMILALKDLGMLDIFDHYVGVSAGSLNLSYILAGQSGLLTSMYFEDMQDKKNLSLLPTHRGDRTILDIRRMHQQALELKPLNTYALEKDYLQSLHLTVSNLTETCGKILTIQEAGSDYFTLLFAGSTIPFIAGDAWNINGNEYLDGGIFYIDPTQAAQELGCTHTMTLYTQPQNVGLKPYGRVTEMIIKRLDEDKQHISSTRYLENLKACCDTFNGLPYGEAILDGMQLYRLALRADVGVGQITVDRDKLLNGLTAGYQSVLDLFYASAKATVLPSIR